MFTTWNNLGVVLVRHRHCDEAMVQFREAPAINQGLRQVQVNLDDVMARCRRAAPPSR
jgi:hypothetical protein